MKYLTALVLFIAVSIKATTFDIIAFGGGLADANTNCFAFVTNGSATIGISMTPALVESPVGKVVEIWGAGPLGVTPSTTNQDFMAIVVSVDGTGTNWTLSHAASVTCYTNFTYGTNNAAAFQKCVNAAGTGDIINIPSGNFLLIPPSNLVSTFVPLSYAEVQSAVYITSGGWTMQGQGSNSTFLIAQGAWLNWTDSTSTVVAMRGEPFQVTNGAINTNAIVFTGFTAYGGVAVGKVPYDGAPALNSTGLGWDVTSDFITYRNQGTIIAAAYYSNCVFAHWRGEILKSVGGTDFYNRADNCIFLDGNATALNIQVTHRWTHCWFDTLKAVEEIVQSVPTGPSWMDSCVITNLISFNGSAQISALTGAAINGLNPPYYFSNNIVWGTASQLGFLVNTWQNLVVVTNYFYGLNSVAQFGGAGYQATTNGNNDSFYLNTASNTISFFSVSNPNSYGTNSNIGITIGYNTWYPASSGTTVFGENVGYGSNTICFSNTVAGPNSVVFGYFNSSQTGQFIRDDLSNTGLPYLQLVDAVGKTNLFNYSQGARFACFPVAANSFWVLDDSQVTQIPVGAQMLITNKGTFSGTLLVSSGRRQVTPITMAPGWSGTFFYRQDGEWRTNGEPLLTTLH